MSLEDWKSCHMHFEYLLGHFIAKKNCLSEDPTSIMLLLTLCLPPMEWKVTTY